MSNEADQKKRTPTEVLVQAMELAEEMAECVVIFRLMKDGQGHSGDRKSNV